MFFPADAPFLVAVGSVNAPKIKAVESVFQTRWPHCQVSAAPTPSGVPDQPWGDRETARGALQRAQRVLALLDADVGVGLEGGVAEGPGGLYLCGWVALATARGQMGLAATGRALLPHELAGLLRSGVELGVAIEQWSGRQGIRHDVGTVGILTAGLLQRDEAFAQGVKLALAALLHPEWYPQLSTSLHSLFSR